MKKKTTPKRSRLKSYNDSFWEINQLRQVKGLSVFLFLFFVFFSWQVTGVQAQSFEIVFTKQINGNDHLFAMNSGGQLSQLTNHPRKDSSPAVASSGDLVFTSERNGWWKIWLYDKSADEYQQLTDASSAEYHPSWSPDEEQIVFVSTRDGNSEVYTMTHDGKQLRNLTNNSADDETPSWHQNTIYYASSIKGVYQLVRRSDNGNDFKIITEGDEDKLQPQLSPDGQTLLFYMEVNGNFDLYTVDTAGKNLHRLTTHPLMDIRPKWSPDGRWIVFERGNKGDNHHVYIMNAEGGSARQLTKSNYNYAPSFVPTGFSFFAN
jgi:TolB protein